MSKRISWLFLSLLIGVVVFFLWQLLKPVQLPEVAMSTFGSETIRARVTQIIEEGEIDLGGIVHVTVKHENNAALAAEAYGRLTGRPGVAITTAAGDRYNCGRSTASVPSRYAVSSPVWL